VLYNGHTKDEFVVQRTTAYVDQVGVSVLVGVALILIPITGTD
jgi:hypothetical protein